MYCMTAKLSRRVAEHPLCQVFINHRGIETKRTVVRLLYDRLTKQRVRPFLDNIDMKPGDKIFDRIHNAIQGCKVGVTVFSPRFCDSYFCLHELSLLVEFKKRIVPIFYDVKPSQLLVRDNGNFAEKDVHRFSLALEEAKYIVGLSHASSEGDWSELVENASDAVIKNLMEVEEEHECIEQVDS